MRKRNHPIITKKLKYFSFFCITLMIFCDLHYISRVQNEFLERLPCEEASVLKPMNKKILEISKLMSASYNPNGPNISLITHDNNSYISGGGGDTTFIITILDSGTNGIMEEVAQISSNLGITWEDMYDSSGGLYLNFTYDKDFSHNHSHLINCWFNVTNNNSISNVFNYQFFIDNSAPEMNVISPQPESYILSNTLLSVSADDYLSGMKSVHVNVNMLFFPFWNYKIDLDYNPGNGNWEYLWIMQEHLGSYIMDFIGTDIAGNVKNETITVIVDNNPPLISLISPDYNSIISGSIDIQFNIQDPISGISDVSARIGDGNTFFLSPISPNFYEFTLNTTDYEDGMLDLHIRAFDNAQQLNQTTIHFSIDNNPPEVLILGNFSIRGTHQWIIICNDTSNLGRIAWKFDQNRFLDLPIEEYQIFSIYSDIITEGLHTITFLFEDNAKPVNQRILEYSAIIDNTSPQVSIKNFRDGQEKYNDEIIEISIYDDNEVTLNYSIDNGEEKEAVKENNTNLWIIRISELNVTEGIHSLKLIGTDICGNKDEDVYFVIIKTRTTANLLFPSLLIVALASFIGLAGYASVLQFKRKDINFKDKSMREYLKHKFKRLKRNSFEARDISNDESFQDAI